MSSPEAEAGPSRPTQTSGPKPPLARKRKAGGDGKKGKVFLEDKAGLLSLMANVTGSKDTIVKTKLDHQRRRNNPAEEKAVETASAQNVDKRKQRNEKKKLDARAFRDAKFALMKEAKEKKMAKKGKSSSAVGAAKAVEESRDGEEKPKKKRVGFA